MSEKELTRVQVLSGVCPSCKSSQVEQDPSRGDSVSSIDFDRFIEVGKYISERSPRKSGVIVNL